jgi:hypothetical protein
MPTITEDAMWQVAEKARKVAQQKSDSVAPAAKIAAELAVSVISEFAVLTDEEGRQLNRTATELAAERFPELVADIADELVDHYLV